VIDQFSEPGNALYNGKQLWLVDWEGAAMGDPVFDIASLINWFVLDSQQEATLLEAYFRHIPTEHEVRTPSLARSAALQVA
jgi:thiamine kinase-like enzyme